MNAPPLVVFAWPCEGHAVFLAFAEDCERGSLGVGPGPGSPAPYSDDEVWSVFKALDAWGSARSAGSVPPAWRAATLQEVSYLFAVHDLAMDRFDRSAPSSRFGARVAPRGRRGRGYSS